MNSHLNEEQFTEWLLGTNDQPTAEHLERCDNCRLESEHLRRAIVACRASVSRAAERNETFWARQRSAISSRLRRQRFVPYLRFTAVAIAVLLVLAAFVLTRSPRPIQQAKNELSDDVVLQQVENSLERSYPSALAPAVLIDQERSRTLTSANKLKLSAARTTSARGKNTLANSKQKEQQQQ